jgi:hypothetical protein
MSHLTSDDSQTVPRALNRATGVGLLELMVAVALALILLDAVFQFFNVMERTSAGVTLMTQVNESLRGSMDLISRDLYAAGTGIPIGGIPLPNGTGSTSVTRPGASGQVFPTNNGVLSSITPGYGVSGTIDGEPSDEITLVTVDENWTNLPPLQISSMTSSTANGYTVNVTIPASCVSPGCNPSLSPSGTYNVNIGDLLMFSTPGGLYALGMVTNVNTSSNTIYFHSDPLGLDQVCAAQGCTGSIDSLKEAGVYPAGMALTKVDMITYYISNTNSAHPYSLMRELNAGNETQTPTQPVSYGVNSLQFSYDLSTGAADLRNPNPSTPNQIRNVNLTVSGISNVPLPSGQFFSNTLSSSVTIRNLEYVNQFP